MKMTSIERWLVNRRARAPRNIARLQMALERLDLSGVHAVLEVGCGAGDVSAYLARQQHLQVHGLDVDAANDGVPETSLGAVPANLCADGSTDPTGTCAAAGGTAPGAGNVIVYMYAADHAGTYMYHCHQEADIHVNMGMGVGAVTVNDHPPVDVVSRASKAMVEICRLDGL